MKRIFFLLVLLPGIFISCEKSSNSSTASAEQAFLSQIKALSFNKQRPESGVTNGIKEIWKAIKKAVVVVGADVGGFFSGAGGAITFIKATGGDPEQNVGWIIGAGVAVGAGASAKAGSSMVAPGGGGWNGQTGSGVNVIPNTQNMYSYAGAQHNSGLDIYASNFGLWTNFQTVNVTGMTQIFNTQLLPAFGGYTYPGQEDDFAETIALTNANSPEDYNMFFNHLYENGTINDVQYNTVKIYFENLETATSPQQVNTITDSFENTVIQSQLNATDKAMLLSSFAVSRYSFAYWYSLSAQ